MFLRHKATLLSPHLSPLYHHLSFPVSSLRTCPPQFPACDEPLHASLHDSGLDVLCGDHPEECGVREGGAAEGDHEDYGIE